MYFFVQIVKHVQVPPEQLGPNLFTYVEGKLNEMRGSFSIKYGYLIAIFNIEKIHTGIVTQAGDALFTVIFKALVFRPLQSEVLDGLITGIERVGVEVEIGCVKVFIPHTKIPKHLEYIETKQVFQSTEDSSIVLEKDKLLRFRVLNISIKGAKESGQIVSQKEWNRIIGG